MVVYVIGGCEHDVIMYMFTVYMRCKNIGISALQKPVGKFLTDLVGYLVNIVGYVAK